MMRSVGPHNAIMAHNQTGGPNTTPKYSNSPLQGLAKPRPVTCLWDTRPSSTDYQDLTWDMAM